jgi:hypothetical protein
MASVPKKLKLSDPEPTEQTESEPIIPLRGLSQESIDKIIKHMIPVCLSRGYVFTRDSPMNSIDHNFMYDFENWSKIIGIIDVPMVIDYETNLKTPGKYTIMESNNGPNQDTRVKCTETSMITTHPDGQFFFKPYLDEIYKDLPKKLKDHVLSGKNIYVCTRFHKGDQCTDHKGFTRVIYPEELDIVPERDTHDLIKGI